MERYAIIDIETTGGSPLQERITEIAIVLHDGEKVLETYSTLVNPERSIPWNITFITGITDAMVAHAPTFPQVAKKIVEITEGAVFVAHNVKFDYGFVKEEFARLGYTYSRKRLCTVQLSRKTFPGLKSYSLSNLKKHFGIESERAHRALDDTLATVTLFEMILAAQTGAKDVRFKTFLNYGLQVTKLPAAMTIEDIEALPEECGVYYFHDSQGVILYVGKSINIRKRIMEHLSEVTTKSNSLHELTHSISFTVTGSELVALLLESAEIKKHLPRINKAQRIASYQGGIFTFTDQNGYKHLAAGALNASNRKKLDVLAEYPKAASAKAHLESLSRRYVLCAKLCGLDGSQGACFQHSIKKCLGACIGDETPESYNERLQEALVELDKGLEGTFTLIEPGRGASEIAVIAVVDGKYCGYGYMDAGATIYSMEDVLESLEKPTFKDPDAPKLIRTYKEKKGVKVVRG